MTIKEAIQQLERLKFSAVRMGNIELCNALYMAIRALEKEQETWFRWPIEPAPEPEWIVRYPEEYDEWKYKFTCSGKGLTHDE
ncbi:MAG: hypothetical protein IJA29_07150 [Lachnospiraceae bacterium]|nr:hypothetical protein [Lachnospiraceae bacterium]